MPTDPDEKKRETGVVEGPSRTLDCCWFCNRDFWKGDTYVVHDEGLVHTWCEERIERMARGRPLSDLPAGELRGTTTDIDAQAGLVFLEIEGYPGEEFWVPLEGHPMEPYRGKIEHESPEEAMWMANQTATEATSKVMLAWRMMVSNEDECSILNRLMMAQDKFGEALLWVKAAMKAIDSEGIMKHEQTGEPEEADDGS